MMAKVGLAHADIRGLDCHCEPDEQGKGGCDVEVHHETHDLVERIHDLFLNDDDLRVRSNQARHA